MSTVYKILFTISIRHDYYTSRACTDFLIRPAADCMELFATYRLLFRQAGNKAIVLAPVENMKPVLEPDNGINFRFYLFCRNPYFINFTNFDQQDYRSQKFYASNQHNNFSGEVAYLTKALSEYSDQADYKQGSLAVNAQNEVAECLQVNPSGPNSKPLTDKKSWRKLPGNKTQYATPDDLISFRPDLLPLIMEDGANIKLEGYNSITNDFTDTIIQHKTDLSAGRGEAIRIFSQLSARRYRLTINEEKEIIYYDPSPDAHKAWGIVEIHHQKDLPAEMQILDKGKLPADKNDPARLTPRNFIIHFHNRSVIWKYNLLVMEDAYTISDSGTSKFSFEKKDSSFISEEPIPVTEEPLKTLSLKKNNATVVDILKNPGRDKVSKINKPDPFDSQKKKTVQYLCSEMYLTI